MRRILLLLMLTISLSMSATSKDTLNAVTFVSYEQSWLDDKGALALKNNTNEDIHNVTYRITYLDMKGNPLDYQDYSSEVEIAPGMTKKVDIPAYEHDREYSYYRSGTAFDKGRRFKIKFQLTGYNNLAQEEASETQIANDTTSSNENSNNEGWIIALLVLGFLFVLGLYIGMYALVALMAKRRNRNAALWIAISLLGTPLIAIVVLLCLGTANDPFEDREFE